jgi:hypothetical protein
MAHDREFRVLLLLLLLLFILLTRSLSSSLQFICPPGDYLTVDERANAETALEHVHFTATTAGTVLSYEDTEELFPQHCAPRGRLSDTRTVCGLWSTKHGNFKVEWKCLRHRPDTARSEYFLLKHDKKGSAHAPSALVATQVSLPRLIVSRIWKTGSTALAEVFRCLYGKSFLHYAALERQRGPFIAGMNRLSLAQLRRSRRSTREGTEGAWARIDDHASSNFTHAAVVRDPLEKFISGYREVLARMTFPAEISAQGGSNNGSFSFSFSKRQQDPQGSPLPLLRPIVGWPRVMARPTGLAAEAHDHDYGWLWAGVDTSSVSTAPWKLPPSHFREQFGGGSVDEAVRFEAFVRAAECGRTGLWWAHVASSGWFLGKAPRHVLSRPEAEHAFFSNGAATPAEAAFRSPPLPLRFILRQERLAEDLEGLLVALEEEKEEAVVGRGGAAGEQDAAKGRVEEKGNAARLKKPEGGQEGTWRQARQMHQRKRRMRQCIRKVLVDQRHNTGGGLGGTAAAWRAHVPSAHFYRELLFSTGNNSHDVRPRPESEAHNSGEAATAALAAPLPPKSLLCRIVAILRQDYACFGYEIPQSCS